MCWLFLAVHSLSLVAARSGHCLVAVHRFLVVVDSLAADHGLSGECVGFSSCGVRAQQLMFTGLVVLGRVGSSRTRD